MQSDITPEFRASWEIPSYDVTFWHGKKRHYCLVIPVINEGELIKQLLKRIYELELNSIVDILIIDGGSKDGSLDINLFNDFKVNGLIVKTGLGKLSSQLRCAYSFAIDQNYDGIVTIDGNDKDDPKSIIQFITALKNGYDFIQASRFVKGGVGINTPIPRWLAIKFIHAPILSLFSGFRWTDTTQGFRGYSRKVLIDEQLHIFRSVFEEYELLAYMNYRAPLLGYKCIELPTVRIYPKGVVPTKIKGINGQFKLLRVLFETCFKKFNP